MAMTLPPDFKEFLKLLKEHDVRIGWKSTSLAWKISRKTKRQAEGKRTLLTSKS